VIRDDQVVVGIDGFQKGYFESRDREMLHPTKTPVHGTYGLRMTVSRDHSLVASGDYDGNVVVWRDSPAAVVSKFHVEGTVVQAMVDLPKKSGREEKRSMLHLEESSGCQKIVVSLVLSISEKP
jgi:hypothetical protein